MRHLLTAAKVAFLVGVLVAAWLSIRGREAELGTALGRVSIPALLGALAVTLLGLWLTSRIWRDLLSGFGVQLPPREARSIFFLGQLGKYLPGAVWSIGAQAALVRRHGTPIRVTTTAGLLFLGIHVASAGAIAAAADLRGAIDLPGPGWLSALAGAGALVGLTGLVMTPLATAISGTRWRDDVRATLRRIALIAATWLLYAVGLWLLSTSLGSTVGIATLLGAFAASYAVGVVVVIAPAGVGAREAVLIGLLSPAMGWADAAALALLARAIHTGADVMLAATTAALARRQENGNRSAGRSSTSSNRICSSPNGSAAPSSISDQVRGAAT